MTHSHPHVIRGFTLVELMTVIALIAIIVGIGVPNFRSFIVSQRLGSTSNEFLYALALTRSEAIQRGTRVDMTPINAYYRSQHGHDDNAASTQDWSAGWIIFVNKHHDTNTEYDAGDTLILVHDALDTGIAIKATLTDSSRPYIAYNGMGRSQTNGNPLQAQSGTWEFTMEGRRRLVQVGLMGRPRICNPDAGKDCTTEQTD